MNHLPFLWLQVALAFASFAAHARIQSTVEVIADLLERFDPAQASNTSSTVVRRPATAGGIKQNGLFEHPQSTARPARVLYEIDLPAVDKEGLLLLAFDIALADGIQFGKGEDGVRFIVELDGRRVFARDWRECRWESCGVDLTAEAGRRVQLALLVEAKGNTSYDWATWGNPRLLHFNASSQLSANVIVANGGSFPVGPRVLAVKCTSESIIRVIPNDGRKAMEWTVKPANGPSAGPGWLARDLDLGQASRIELGVETAGAPPTFWLAAYPAQPKVVRLSATRALVHAGETVSLRAEVKNDGRGKLAEGEAMVKLRVGSQSLATRRLPALGPHESGRVEWTWVAPDKAGTLDLTAQLIHKAITDQPSATIEVLSVPQSSLSLQNRSLKLDFIRESDGYAYARVYGLEAGQWIPLAVWRPLFQIVSDTKDGERVWEIRPNQARRSENSGAGEAQSVEFAASPRDADGVVWRARLRVSLPPDQPQAQIHYEWQADQPRQVKALRGPNLYVGDGTTGDAKTWGLFPGLECLYGGERSSNPRDFAPPLDDRRTPHPHKITIPLMAITLGPDSQPAPANPGRFFAPDSLKDRNAPRTPQSPITNHQSPITNHQSPITNHQSPVTHLQSDFTVALTWDPFQRWDSEHAFPAARFASPNFDEGMRNHRLGLFLPSVPDWVAENADRASQPYRLAAGRTLQLEATLLVTPGPATGAAREWLRQVGGLPKPLPWPRSFQAELDICRTGFLKTVWDASSEKWRHCIGWAGSHAPGFAALLWLDSQLAETPEARRQSRDRVELAVRNMLRDGGPALFTSKANCHILEWELPFLHGYLPEALAGLDRQMRQLIGSQRPEGGWLYQPANEQQADLGQAGDSVLGTCANRASTLLRYARITGDPEALASGLTALRFMEQFRVPRGGQTWECPMYEPDILAAAYAVRACHDAFRATGDTRWLHDAVYWAETGVPFVYLWTLPDRPMMLGSTIPVFGSTFYTHTWLAVPVQWCGLVYAYHVFHLARELERTPLGQTDSPLPLALHFSPSDWRRMVELITVSGMHQQFAEGERIGTYPDSISDFQRRNPAFINPEDILLNVLALQGLDPDIQTERVRTDAGELVVSSGAQISNLRSAGSTTSFELRFFPEELSHTLVSGVKPREVRTNGDPLPSSSQPVRREAGWWWEEKRQRLFLAVPHSQRAVKVEIFP